MSLKSWFEKAFPNTPEPQPRAERREVLGLEAIHWTGSSPGLDIVRNISSTGMYLVTRERWQEGEINPVRLVYQELEDDSAEKQVTIETRTVRCGEDGLGLSFILPECMELWLWKADERIASRVLLHSCVEFAPPQVRNSSCCFGKALETCALATPSRSPTALRLCSPRSRTSIGFTHPPVLCSEQ